MADVNDLQSLQGVLLGLGLNSLPQLLMKLHAAQNAGRNLSEGRSHKDDGPSTKDQGVPGGVGPAGDGYDISSVLAPLLTQLGAGQMPIATPGMRPGMPPAPLPRMPGLPRTMAAGASPAGF